MIETEENMTWLRGDHVDPGFILFEMPQEAGILLCRTQGIQLPLERLLGPGENE